MGTKRRTDRLAEALFPKARREVLALMYGHPDEAFYLREVAQRTGLGHGSVQRELARLARGGLLVRTERGRHVYFQANRSCPVFEELRGLTTKTMGAVARLRSALSSMAPQIVAAFVYGSVARGEEGEASDLDLMIIGDVSLAQVVRAVHDVEKELGREVTPVVYSREEAREKARGHFLGSVRRGPMLFVLGDEQELEGILGERLDSQARDVS